MAREIMELDVGAFRKSPSRSAGPSLLARRLLSADWRHRLRPLGERGSESLGRNAVTPTAISFRPWSACSAHCICASSDSLLRVAASFAAAYVALAVWRSWPSQRHHGAVLLRQPGWQANRRRERFMGSLMIFGTFPRAL